MTSLKRRLLRLLEYYLITIVTFFFTKPIIKKKTAVNAVMYYIKQQILHALQERNIYIKKGRQVDNIVYLKN